MFKCRYGWSRLSLPAALALALPFSQARADTFEMNFSKPRMESVDRSQAGLDTRGSVVGVETFDSMRQRSSEKPFQFKTSFDTAGTITGRYSGAISITAADRYGGAGGLGNYIVTFENGSYILDLLHDSSIPGLNYFGMQISALDPGNTLEFRRNGRVIQTYLPSAFAKQLGQCTDGNPYCGNPSAPEQNTAQHYVFINFFDTDGYFDQIRFRQEGGGSFESDNHTVGYRSLSTSAMAFAAAIKAPEPASIAMLGMGLLCVGMIRARWAVRNPDVS